MNFEFQNPTRLIFGAGSLSRLGEIATKFGKRALLVTGGGSVKRNGTFDRAAKSLSDYSISVFECAGVEPNPRISSVKRGALTARENECDLVIALGGGSTMDASKVIAAATLYHGDPWDMIGHGQDNWVIPTQALPIITVPTLAATGSEMNKGAVISNDASKVKSFVMADCLFPKVALVDPELTLTVPKDQTAYGVCDIITHVTEGYFTGVDGTPIQDRFAEGVIINAIEWGHKAVVDGSDLEARTQVQWASIVALNGWVNVGTNYVPPVHMIEHALSAHHNITHGAGLAVINPAYMRFVAKARPERFVQFSQRIFGLSADKDDLSLAMAGVVIASQSGHRLPALTPEQDKALATTPVDELLSLPMLQPDQMTDSLHAYQVSKRGNSLRVMAEAVRWGKRGARVNTISPGIIIMPLARDELNGPRGEGYKHMLELCPARRAGTPDEVGTIGALLMGPGGAFITGSDFLMDGGVTAAYRFGELAPK